MSQAAATLQGRRILVVEDDFLVAQVLCDILEDAGAEVLGPIGWLNDALAFIRDRSSVLDCVILDLNLHGEMSYSIADALVHRKVPFVFATGYGANAVDSGYRSYPRCEKPITIRDLVAALIQG